MKFNFLKKNRSIFFLASVFVLLVTSCSEERVEPELEYGTVTDVEGNIYKTIQIGDQVWMAENLKTTTYSDGVPINEISNDSLWRIDTLGAYCWYENDNSNAEHNGALYNWYAVATQKLCPIGWHVPTEEEWRELLHTLGGIGCEELSVSGWNYQSMESKGQNYQGILSGRRGHRYQHQMEYAELGETGYFWLDLEYAERAACGAAIRLHTESWGTHFKNNGFSIRCIKD